MLRDCAAAARARIVDAVVRRVEPGDPATVTYAADDGQVGTCAARLVLDCSGRAGIVARRGLRRADSAPHPGHRRGGNRRPGRRTSTRTLVESYPDGGVVGAASSARQCTVMIEPDRSAQAFALRADAVPLREVYQRELEKSVELRDRLAHATLASTPWTCDASIYDSARAADQGVLLVGDAASFIEPLSSAGVKKALLSAWRAAVVANTCLGNPALAGAAQDLYIARERQVYAECMRRSSAFFAEAAAAYGTPFWSARAEEAHGAGPAAEDRDVFAADMSDAALARDPDVRSAFEHLRASDHLRFRAAAALRFAPVAIIEGREVVMRDALIVPARRAAPVRRIDLAALARLATAGGDVPALIAAITRRSGRCRSTDCSPGFLLVARHALVAEAPEGAGGSWVR